MLVVHRSDILENVFTMHSNRMRIVDTHIKILGQNLEERSQLDETVRGYGYRLLVKMRNKSG